MEPKVKRVYMPKMKVFVAVITAVVAVVVLVRLILLSNRFITETGLSPSTVIGLIVNGGASLKEIDGRTNVLLLGISGGTHTGADLTDTIMILSFSHEARSLSLISVPRDIWSDTLKDKINSSYHYGEEKSAQGGSASGRKKRGGLTLAKAIVEDMVGLPMHYSLVIDFSVFEEVINLVDGVSVNVPVAFTDPEFPIEGKEDEICAGDPKFSCRYESLHFDSGVQQMDGARALKYVRSRLAVGDEGTDFARARRQQEVLLALKQKLTSPSVWLSPRRLRQLFLSFEKAIDSDMNIGELATIGKLFAAVDTENTTRISLEGELYSPPTIWYGRYVLIPKESFEEIHSFVKNQLK